MAAVTMAIVEIEFSMPGNTKLEHRKFIKKKREKKAYPFFVGSIESRHDKFIQSCITDIIVTAMQVQLHANANTGRGLCAAQCLIQPVALYGSRHARNG
jgi:hypothetical protein